MFITTGELIYWIFAQSVLLGFGILIGLDIAANRRTRRDAEDAARFREAIRKPNAVAPSPRCCVAGAERCLCNICLADGIPPRP